MARYETAKLTAFRLYRADKLRIQRLKTKWKLRSKAAAVREAAKRAAIAEGLE